MCRATAQESYRAWIRPRSRNEMRLDRSRPRAYTDIGEVDWRAMSGSFRVQVPVNQKLLSLNISQSVEWPLSSQPLTIKNYRTVPFYKSEYWINFIWTYSACCPSAGELLLFFFRQNIHRKSIIKPTTNRRSLCGRHNLYAHHLRHGYNIYVI